MSDARDNPELLEPRVGEVIIPLRSMSKSEIQSSVLTFLERMKEFDPPERFVYLKQMEEAIKKAIEIQREEAFNTTGDRFRGMMSGEILGHQVRLTYPERWQYSVAIDRLKLQQKLDLESLQSQERAKGIATKESSKGIISITLKP